MDSKASINIKFSVFGSKEYKMDAWINYFPAEGGCSLDQRIIDFFEESYQEAYEKYQERCEKIREEEDEKHNKELIESQEKKHLKMLKEKYEEVK